MIEYFGFIKAINVGKINRIKMDHLVTSIKKLDVEDVRTFIQSGNIYIKSKHEITNEMIEELLLNDFNINTTVFLMSVEELETINKQNPHTTTEDRFVYVTIFDRTLDLSSLEGIDENLEVVNNVVYIKVVNGYGDTKYSNKYLEKKFNCNCTTRNLKGFKTTYTLRR